jgi:hypothetical protein
MPCSRALLVLTGLAFTACSGKDKPATVADSSPATVVQDATTDDLGSYKLDMDKLQRYVAASRTLEEESKRNPSILIDVNIGNEPISESVATIERNEMVTDALKRSGTTPREFVMTMAAYLQAEAASAALDSNPNARIPAGQNPDNVEFVRAHRAEIDNLMKGLGR